MFLHVSVILFTGDGVGVASQHASQGHVTSIQGGSASWEGGCIIRGGWVVGVLPTGSSASRGGSAVGTRKAGDTHPTGMLSFCSCFEQANAIRKSGAVGVPEA